MAVTFPSGLYQRDFYVMKTVVKRGVPIATVVGGGYSRDIDKLALRHSIVHRAATQVKQSQFSFSPDIIFQINRIIITFFPPVSGLERVWDVKPCPELSGC